MDTSTRLVVFRNNSSRAGSACLYQRPSGPMPQGLGVLAWRVAYASPTTQIEFSWSETRDFVWVQRGPLARASQTWPADLSRSNQVTLTSTHGTYTFTDQKEGRAPGTLILVEDGTLPPDGASVGIGMDGSATWMTSTQPNVTLNIPPAADYWIAFGDYTCGQVLDPDQIDNALLLRFPPNTRTVTVTMTAHNTWQLG